MLSSPSARRERAGVAGELALLCDTWATSLRRIGEASAASRALRIKPRTAISAREFPYSDERAERPMAQQYIFQMQGLTKAYPGGKKVFENIWLSFYSDAKIGVVGVNGSGKSTLLKIMAGLDTEFQGEAKAADGVKMGYLEQEPHLDPNLNVWENVIAWCEEKKDRKSVV
jgi:ABC-type glutathione transport system ATPase component